VGKIDGETDLAEGREQPSAGEVSGALGVALAQGLEHLAQRLSADALHREERAAALLAQLVHRHHHRMLELALNPGFANEALQSVFPTCGFGAHQLSSDLAAD